MLSGSVGLLVTGLGSVRWVPCLKATVILLQSSSLSPGGPALHLGRVEQ